MRQVHSSRVENVDHIAADGERHVIQGVDGIVTSRSDLVLAAYGADCAVISFWDEDRIGICHAGWRGVVDGLPESMISQFGSNVQCHIGPILHTFQILKDECYDRIVARFGERHFYDSEGIIMFNFKDALLETLDRVRYIMDPRSTGDHTELASSRIRPRPKPVPHNRLAIWRVGEGEVRNKLFIPGESLTIE